MGDFSQMMDSLYNEYFYLSILCRKEFNMVMDGSGNSSRNTYEYQIWTILRNTSHLINIAQNRDLISRNTGITTRQIAMLHVINRLGDEATPVEIARKQARARTTISNILIRLEKMGLLTRTKNLERSNLIRVALTDRGKEVLAQTDRQESIHQIMSVLTLEQLQQLDTIIRIVRESAIKKVGLGSDFMTR
jgi:DNA-binding MarR family transcriptional regulator